MINADVHEPSVIINLLKEKISVKVARNEIGDYTFNNITIERKTLSDFFSSIASGRLFSQLESMMKFDKSYLIIEGFFDFSYISNPVCLYNSLRSIAIDMDVSIIFTKDMEDSASAIKKIYYSQFYLPECRVSLKSNSRLRHLKAFFGTSPDKLTKLFNKFRSVRQLANADKKSMRAVRGIGDKTVLAIEIALDENILGNKEKSFYSKKSYMKKPMNEDEEKYQAVWIILNAVKNLKLGKNRLAAYLKGSKSKSISNINLEQTYGGLIWLDIPTIEGYIEQMENIGLIQRKIVPSYLFNYSVFEITEAGRFVLDEKKQILLQKLKKPLTVGDSEEKTLGLLRLGKKPAEIAKERGLAESTVYSHFARLIETGSISSLEVIPFETDQRVRAAAEKFRVLPYAREIKEILPDVSYDEIRCVFAGMKREGNR